MNSSFSRFKLARQYQNASATHAVSDAPWEVVIMQKVIAKPTLQATHRVKVISVCVNCCYLHVFATAIGLLYNALTTGKLGAIL